MIRSQKKLLPFLLPFLGFIVRNDSSSNTLPTLQTSSNGRAIFFQLFSKRTAPPNGFPEPGWMNYKNDDARAPFPAFAANHDQLPLGAFGPKKCARERYWRRYIRPTRDVRRRTFFLNYVNAFTMAWCDRVAIRARATRVSSLFSSSSPRMTMTVPFEWIR